MTIRDITKKLRSIQYIYTDGRVGGCVSFANDRIWVCAIKYQYIQHNNQRKNVGSVADRAI
jgi:hypothetical protein